MKKKSNIIILALLLIAAIAVGYLVYYFTVQYQNNKVYEQLKKETKTEEKKQDEPEKDEHNHIPTTVDFQSLWEINPEVVGWINVPGTNIDYPILQSASDDTYYLNHTIEGEAGYPGSIYIEGLNNAAFSDFNTVIYGHNMKAGTMFADLHNYESEEYMLQNPTIVIDTPEQKCTYQIFAAVTYTDEYILKAYDFTVSTSRQKFLDSIKSSAGFCRDDVEVDENSQIITLSTCISGKPQNRFLVEAVRVYE